MNNQTPHINLPLDRLMQDLTNQGFRITPDMYVRVQTILQELGKEYYKPDEEDTYKKLAYIIAPIVVKNPQEQQIFDEVFDDYVEYLEQKARAFKASQEEVPATSLDEKIKPPIKQEWYRKVLIWLGVFGVLGLGILFYDFFSYKPIEEVVNDIFEGSYYYEIGDTVYFEDIIDKYNVDTTDFTWDFGDDTFDSLNLKPFHIYDEKGFYKTTLTCKIDGIKHLITRNIYVSCVGSAISISLDHKDAEIGDTALVIAQTYPKGLKNIEWDIDGSPEVIDKGTELLLIYDNGRGGRVRAVPKGINCITGDTISGFAESTVLLFDTLDTLKVSDLEITIGREQFNLIYAENFEGDIGEEWLSRYRVTQENFPNQNISNSYLGGSGISSSVLQNFAVSLLIPDDEIFFDITTLMDYKKITFCFDIYIFPDNASNHIQHFNNRVIIPKCINLGKTKSTNLNQPRIDQDSSGITTYTYDRNGNIVAQRNNQTNESFDYTYDVDDKLIKQIDSKGEVTTYKYDADGNLTGQRNNSGTMFYEYDGYGGITSWLTDDKTGAINYIYDDSNITRQYNNQVSFIFSTLNLPETRGKLWGIDNVEIYSDSLSRKPTVAELKENTALNFFHIQPTKKAYLYPILLFLLLTALATWLFKHLNKAKTSPFAPNKNAQAPYKIPFPEQAVIPATPQVYQLAKMLRQRQAGWRYRMDIPATVRATIAKGGFPVIRQRGNTRAPEYLFLIDLETPDAQQVSWLEYVLQLLRREEVLMACYYFKQDPSWCWNSEQPDGLDIDELYQRFPDHRLVIYGDGDYWLDSFEARTDERVLRDFPLWSQRALLTTVPPENWSYRERLLQQYFNLIPGDMKEPLVLASALMTQAEDFEQIRQDRSRSTEQFIEFNSLDDIRDFLQNPRLVDWLAATTVYPEPQWEITLAIGKALEQVKGYEGILTLPNLRRLTQIKWMNRDAFPENLRQDLLAHLHTRPHVEAHAREQVISLLQEAKNGLAPNSYAYTDAHIKLIQQQRKVTPVAPEIEDEAIRLADEGLINPDASLSKIRQRRKFATIAGAALTAALLTLILCSATLSIFPQIKEKWGLVETVSFDLPIRIDDPRFTDKQDSLGVKIVSENFQRAFNVMANEDYLVRGIPVEFLGEEATMEVNTKNDVIRVDSLVMNPTPMQKLESNCNDGIKNWNETDIDCGGVCPPCTILRPIIGAISEGCCPQGQIDTLTTDTIDLAISTDIVATPQSDCLNQAVRIEIVGSRKCNQRLVFKSNLSPDCQLSWDFGNGKQFNDQVEMSFGNAGLYEVKLYANDLFKANKEFRINCELQQPTSTCNNKIQDGDETGIDCGGSCAPCRKTESETSLKGISSQLSTSQLEIPVIEDSPRPNCYDGIQNNEETAIDCGGSKCSPCGAISIATFDPSFNIPSFSNRGMLMINVERSMLPKDIQNEPILFSIIQLQDGQIITRGRIINNRTNITIHPGRYQIIVETSRGTETKIIIIK